MEATSEELNAPPRSLDQVLDELTAEYQQHAGRLLFLERGAGGLPHDQISAMEALRTEVTRLGLRIQDLQAEITLRRARACVPPLFGRVA